MAEEKGQTTGPDQRAPAPGPGVPALALEAVHAAYGPYRALFGVSLAVPPGGGVALIGPNGAGKSTVARVASGLVVPSAGRVLLDGEDVTGRPAHEIARRGLVHVPEGRAVFSSLSVEENLVLSFAARVGRRGVGAALERAYAAFPVLAERRRQEAGTLSGGQQRVLSLAKVLAVAPRCLVVDELSLGLAPVMVDAVYEGLAAARAAGTAVLVVEQHVERALGVVDDAVVLAQGRVTWRGPADQAQAAVGLALTGGGGDPAESGAEG
ncbi:ABC transporter ATP-binding protein [Aciditerrimonas ferrireducens]|uniref:ABC transporter ATP-binding protein n=1 Tax=Aciditerrimonas ferrireducens TaxID=667306 RepID=A0ABV6C2I5_9ACTN